MLTPEQKELFIAKVPNFYNASVFFIIKQWLITKIRENQTGSRGVCNAKPSVLSHPLPLSSHHTNYLLSILTNYHPPTHPPTTN
jgi:hypothetical protein